MKNKLLSIVLALVMVMSISVMPVAGLAAGTGDYYSENFNDVSSVEQLIGGDYGFSYLVDDVSGKTPLTVENNALKIGNGTNSGGFKVNLKKDGSAITSGSYEISYKMTTPANGEQGNFTTITNSFASIIGKNGDANKESMILGIHPNGFLIKASGCDGKGYENNWTVSTTYDVKTLINIDERVFQVIVKDSSGNEVINKGGLLLQTDNITGFAFTTWGATEFVIDDIVVAPTSESASNVIENESFERFTGYWSSTNNYENLYNAGWVGNSNNAYMLTIDNDTDRGKVLKIPVSASEWWTYDFANVEYSFDGDVGTTGKFRASFSMKVEEGAKPIMQLKGTSKDEYVNFFDMIAADEWGYNQPNIRAYSGGSQPRLSLANYGKWYDFAVTVDPKSKCFDLTVKDGVNVLITKKNIAVDSLEKITAFKIYNEGIVAGSLFLDDVKLERLASDYISGEDEYVIYSQNFNSFVNIGDEYGSNIISLTDTPPANVAYTEISTGDKALALNASDSLQLHRLLNVADKVDISLKVKTDAQFVLNAFDVNTGKRVALAGLQTTTGGGNGGLYRTVPGATFSGSTNSLITNDAKLHDGFITIKVTIDPTNKTQQTSVYDKDGKLIGNAAFNDILFFEAESTNNQFTLFGGLQISSWGDGAMVDDIKIAYHIDKPEISNDKIKLVDINGLDMDTTQGAIQPIADKVVLDFGCKVDEASVKENVTISSVSNGNADYIYKETDTGCELDIVGLLKPNDTYTITVPTGIKNYDRNSVSDTSASLSFTIGKGIEVARINSIKAGDASLTEISQIAGGVTLEADITAVNALPEEMTATVIIAYYNDGIMERAQTADKTINAYSAETYTQSFVVPSDLGTITGVKIFVWNGFSRLKPLTDSIEVGSKKKSGYLGANTHLAHRGLESYEQNAEVMNNAGITMARDCMWWSDVEEVQDVYRIDDEWMKYPLQYKKEGIDTCLIMYATNTNYDNNCFPTSETAIQAFAKYCGYVAKKFKGTVNSFEIWNEPEFSTTMKGNAPTAQEYYNVLKAAYTAIKAENPNATVAAGALTGLYTSKDATGSFLKELLALGGAAYMDVLSVHPYADTGSYFDESGGSSLQARLDNLNTLLTEAGCGDMPIWITEIGCSKWVDADTDTGYTEIEQAANLIRASVISMSNPSIERMYIYNLVEKINDASAKERGYGIVNSLYGETFAYKALSFLTDVISEPKFISKSVEADESARTASAYCFENEGSGNSVTVVWERTGKTATMQISKAETESVSAVVDGSAVTVSVPQSKTCKVYDMYGNAVTPNGGNVELNHDSVYYVVVE